MNFSGNADTMLYFMIALRKACRAGQQALRWQLSE
jgi:hypothetical protein